MLFHNSTSVYNSMMFNIYLEQWAGGNSKILHPLLTSSYPSNYHRGVNSVDFEIYFISSYPLGITRRS